MKYKNSVFIFSFFILFLFTLCYSAESKTVVGQLESFVRKGVKIYDIRYGDNILDWIELGKEKDLKDNVCLQVGFATNTLVEITGNLKKDSFDPKSISCKVIFNGKVYDRDYDGELYLYFLDIGRNNISVTLGDEKRLKRNKKAYQCISNALKNDKEITVIGNVSLGEGQIDDINFDENSLKCLHK